MHQEGRKLKCHIKKDTSKPDWPELMPQDWAMKFNSHVVSRLWHLDVCEEWKQ